MNKSFQNKIAKSEKIRESMKYENFEQKNNTESNEINQKHYKVKQSKNKTKTLNQFFLACECFLPSQTFEHSTEKKKPKLK